MAGNPYLWSTTALTNESADADINWAEGQAPGSVNGSARAMMAGVAGWRLDSQSGTVTAGGTANALTYTSNIAYSALASGIVLAFKASATNTAAATLTLNALAAKAIRVHTAAGESALSASMIMSGGYYIVRYDSAANSAAGAWILQNPNWSANPIAYAADGTVAAPSITFLNDQDTGLYRIGANNIGVAAGGAKVLDIGTAGLGVTGTLSATGVTSITNTTDATSGGAGALVVSGGIYAAKKLYVADATAASSATTGCGIFAGGIGVAGAGYFGGNLRAIGNVYFGAAGYTGGLTNKFSLHAGTNNNLVIDGPTTLATGCTIFGINDAADAFRPLEYYASAHQFTSGGVTVGSPTGGDKGAGNINASNVYDDNVLLTCFGIEYLIDGRIDLIKWDGYSPGGRNNLVHRFADMIKGGFDPRDPKQYIHKMYDERALPGMPTEKEWQHNTLSLGEMHNRLWLSTELLAAAFVGSHTDHESRITALESRLTH